jgi:uncharacterized membrane protein YedE/YeeE|tara:strand:- start:3341 stop:3916 length:576 start_codon:yes stop_codon:yes gene_type:complete
MELIFNPWPWYIAGPIISFVMLFLILFGKTFGMSSNLRTICSIAGAGKYSDFFKFDWKLQIWNLVVILGAIIGGYIAHNFMTIDQSIELNTKTIENLKSLGIENAGSSFMPDQLFGIHVLSSWKGWLFLVLGGMLIGFGTRYAGGCTSGHAISGLSNLQLPSLIAVIGFFVGGLAMTHFLLPAILSNWFLI